MPNKVNLLGKRFSRLLIISESPIRSIGGAVVWVCECDCGNITNVISSSLIKGSTKSCGCYDIECRATRGLIHGQSRKSGKSLTYTSWDAMIGRCTISKNKRHDSYKKVKIDPKWMNFLGFLEDMGERPSNGHTLDRYPNQNGNYEKSNCRWADWIQQSRNRSTNRWLSYEGETMVISDWAKKLGSKYSTISRSIKRGKTFTEIVKFYLNK